MRQDYVTRDELEQRLGRGSYASTALLEQRLRETRASYLGKAVSDVVKLATTMVKLAVVVGTLAYLPMSCVYGPFDTGKLFYSGLTGSESVKHTHIQEAKGLFAKRISKRELNKEDLINFYLELGVVSSEGKEPSEADVSWDTLLDFIEDND